MIGVIFGGDSPEREVSLRTGEAVLGALQRLRIPALAIDARQPMNSWFDQSVAAMFIALHGGLGEDGSVQGVMETAGIPYTGSGVLASALGMDKWRSRQLFRQHQIPVPASIKLTAAAPQPTPKQLDALGEQLFVKPNAQGSSIGCNRVGGNHKELAAALREAFAYDEEVLVERFLEGGEYAVGILDDAPMPVVRIEPDRPFYDYAAKYEDDGTAYHLPSGLAPERERHAQQIALAAWRALGGAGWGRVDLLDSPDGLVVAEINTVPGMTEQSLVPKAAAHQGMGFDELVRTILDLALNKGGPKSTAAQKQVFHSNEDES